MENRESAGALDEIDILIDHYLEHCAKHQTAARAAELAARLPESLRTIQRRFRERGTTLSFEICTRQLNRACKLLEDTELSVAEIAGMSGFGTTRHFVRRFRQKRGCSPTEYRRGGGTKCHLD